MLQAEDQRLLKQHPDFSVRRSLLTPAGRGRSPCNKLPKEIIACMSNGRLPSQREVAAVAGQIWRDCRPSDGPSWEEIQPGSRLYSSMIAAARAALGDITIARPTPPILSSEPSVRWKPHAFS